MTDRAPSEVETVAEVLFWAEPWAIEGYQPPRTMEDARKLAQAVLDAVRGQTRDDTVTLAEAEEAHRVWASRTFADRQEALLTFGDFLRARFGAGRAEGER